MKRSCCLPGLYILVVAMGEYFWMGFANEILYAKIIA
jgi:hypothetical protein